ncbi:putative neprosin [Rosa chinensis]|uniref:Putative neprosin n=1 Tax=Rosa chinensis TaxID=74649 RepID=A0A2P6RXS1_ROSCH|nr:putative neprosin [Rosa chinensis]
MENFLSHGNCYTKVRGLTFFLVVTFFILGKGFVDCRRIKTVENNNPIIKSIKGDEGDVIDCIDIYKQPALSHPLLKNHTIQLNPPSPYPSGLNETESSHQDDEQVLKSWLLNEECPEGTIPILRTQAFNSSFPKSSPPFNGSNVEFTSASGHEYAVASLSGGQYYGAHASVNVWSPLSVFEENSISQIWVAGGHEQARSTVEAGWKGHGYQDGCYNLQCPGFVQVNRKFALGLPIKPVSIYNGKQFEIFISIYKHQSTGQWWVMLQDQALGYWPDKILPSLRGSADAVSWGGEIYNSEIGGRHTSTQMGSGHFPSEGYGKASYFRNIQYLANSGKFVDAQGLIPYVTKPPCYNLIMKNKAPGFGNHFYYGGFGYSERCPK